MNSASLDSAEVADTSSTSTPISHTSALEAAAVYQFLGGDLRTRLGLDTDLDLFLQNWPTIRQQLEGEGYNIQQLKRVAKIRVLYNHYQPPRRTTT